DVLADVHSDGGARDLEHLSPLTGPEIPFLVEDAVVWQKLLVIDGEHTAVMNDGGGIVDIRVGVDEADYGRDSSDVGTDLLEGAEIVVDEVSPQEEVLGRVAGQGELGKGNEVGALSASARCIVDDL